MSCGNQIPQTHFETVVCAAAVKRATESSFGRGNDLPSTNRDVRLAGRVGLGDLANYLRLQSACNAYAFRISSRPMKNTTKLIIATLLMATPAVAQQTHNQYEPPNAPGAGQKILAQLVGIDAAWRAKPQDAKAPYPSMAPLEQYLMPDRNAEIALARTAAPPSISGDARVLVLGRHGYEAAVEGKNGFVCMVERSWTAGVDDPEFWNPKLRAPICLNAPAVRSYLPRTIKKTELVLAGRSKAQIFDAIAAAVARNELPAPEAGAMSYMMSKDGYLGDQNGHWHPHLMFFLPQTDAAAWGADLSGSPVISFNESVEHMTTFLVPVRRWSDGTADIPKDEH